MTTGDDTIARRVADACERRGSQITLRRISKVNGQQPHPPTLVNPVVDGMRFSGETHIAIRASQAVGRLLAGDKLQIGALPAIAVAAPSQARVPGFDPSAPVIPGFTSVTLATPLPSNVGDGALLTPIWSSDQIITAMVLSFPTSLRSDQIIGGDLRLVIPALGLTQPATTDQIMVDDVWYSIISLNPARQRDVLVSWDIHARAI